MVAQEELQRFRKSFDEMVGAAKNILITSHVGPDDDSISSVLTLYSHFKRVYPDKAVSIVYSSISKKDWGYFQNFDKIQFLEDIIPLMPQFDLCICLDGNTYSRFTHFPDDFAQTTCKKICIDHHASEPSKFDLYLRDANAASTVELIYQLFYAELLNLAPRDCELIFLGLIGDTGSFSFVNPNQSYVFTIAERLVREGKVNIQTLKSRYYPYPEKIYAVIQEYTRNARFMQVEGWPRFFCSYGDLTSLINEGYSLNELHYGADIFVGTLTSIKDVPWGFLIYPKKDGFGLSMRSLPGSVNVREIAQTMQIGGGHDRAAGGTFKGEGITAQQCFDQLLAWMKSHSPVFS